MAISSLILELFYPVLIFVLFCMIARGSGGSTKTGLLYAWLALFGLSGVFRILIELSPKYGPVLSFSLFLGFSIFILFRLNLNGIQRFLKFRFQDLAWQVPLIFLLVRSLFPQFDVDSLLYHLSGIKFLAVRHLLPEVQRNLEVASIWYNWIAMEESLLIPMANYDLGLVGGLLGGVFKALAILTVVSLIPRPAYLFRSIIVFLFLIDDHFFFSGQSRFVYLNPCLIGILPLGSWFAFRSLYAPQRFMFPAILAGLIAMCVKLHGIYFLLLFLCVGLIGCFRKKVWPWNCLRSLRISGWLGVGLGCSGFFLLRWIGQGSPLAPFDLLWWKADHQWRDPYILRGLEDGGQLMKLLSSPFRNLVFPGNHSLKAVAVLSVPTLLALSFRRFRSRWLNLAAFSFLISVYWAQHSHMITSGESRYPRYVFGVSVFGLTALAIALFQIWKRNSRHGLYYLSYRVRTFFSYAGALALFLVLFSTIDSRYFNVPSGERPSWRHIESFVRSLFRGKYSLDPGSQHLGSLMLPEVHEDMPVLISCAQEKIGDSAKTGAGLAVFGRGVVTWPMIMLAPGAVGGDQWAGGGYQRGIGDQNDLISFGVRHVILPKRSEFHAMFRNRADELVELELKGSVICESPNLKLIKLE